MLRPMSKAPRSQARAIVILKTGEPVPSVLASRGEFADLIVESIGDAWQGPYEVVDVRTEPLPLPDAAAAFVITGSAANVPNREPWMLRAEAWLREVVQVGTPTLGLCFGHQILAQALGGEVRMNPRGREIGTIRIDRLADDALFDGVPGGFDASVTHVDTVARLPPGAVPLARSEREEFQAIRFSRTCYGVQFHPEMDGGVLRGYIETRREILAGEGFDVEAMLKAVNDGELGRRTLQNFVRHIVKRSAASSDPSP
jgi:GMP synthase (glutamine-hydrolysing)